MALARADTFEGSALRSARWDAIYQAALLVANPPTVASGFVDLEVDVGGSGGAFWFDAFDGPLIGQAITGDFDVATEMQIFDQAGTGLPPSGSARLGVLAAHDPDRSTVLNYVHRGIGRAPGGTAGSGIVDEWKSTTDSVSVWDTFAAPDVVTARAWVRLRRDGSLFTSWTSTDGVTWGNEHTSDRPDLPATLQVGLGAYSSAADADLRARFYTFTNVPIVSPNAIAFVDLEVDGYTGIAASETIGESDPLVAGTDYLLIARGNARNNGNGIRGELDVRVGGTIWGVMESLSTPFGAPAYGATDSPQLATFALVTASSGDTLEFVAEDDNGDGVADVCRAFAIDLSDLDLDDQRFHVQTANSATIVTTPTSGYTEVGSPLVVTPPRSGTWLLFASCEYVPDGTEADTDDARIRATIDGVQIDGTVKHAGLGFGGVPALRVGNYAIVAPVELTAATEYSFAIEADGTASNANIGYRRVRLHLIEAAAFPGVELDADTAGLTVAAGAVANADVLVELEPAQPTDWIVLTTAPGQFSAWPRSFLRVESTDDRPGGVDAANGTGTGTGDDMTISTGVHLLRGVAGASATLRLEAASGGVQNLWGDDCARTSDGTGGGALEGGAIRLIAIPLETASTVVDAAADFDVGVGLTASAETIVDAVAGFGLAVELAAAATVRVEAAAAFRVRVLLRVGSAAAGVLWDGSDGDMAALIDQMRGSGASPAVTPVRVNLTTAGATQALSPTPTSPRSAIVAGGTIVADEACTVEFWDGVPEAEGASQLCEIPLAAGVAFPLALLLAQSSPGNAVYLRVVEAVSVQGRAIAIGS